MANMMDLVRELKSLNARKKAGEQLSEEELKRRKELKKYLKTALANQSQAPQPQASSKPAPKPAPQPAPTSRPASSESGPAAPSPAPSGYKPSPNAFAIQGADGILEEAASSKAVNALDRKPQASKADLEESEAKAEAAVRANQKRDRPKSPEEAAEQAQEVITGNQYTAPEVDLWNEGYYAEYEVEGYNYVEEGNLDLAPIDPREMELHRAGLSSTGPSAEGSITVTVPPNLAFIDDFPALYTTGALPPPHEEVEADVDDPNLIIPGKRKVTVHLLSGGVKRGVVRTLRRDDHGFRLEPIGTGQAEDISMGQLKAMFVHRSKGKEVQAQGPNLTVTFQDRKRVQGVSDDYQPGVPTFSLVPPPGRGQFERIIVNSAAVAQVT